MASQKQRYSIKLSLDGKVGCYSWADKWGATSETTLSGRWS
jgi:hypothetical protein